MIIARLSQIPYIVIVVRIVHYHEWRLFNFYALSALLGLWSNWLSDIQTVNTALLTMYSVDIVFFVVNISEMIYSNNPSVSLLTLSAHQLIYLGIPHPIGSFDNSLLSQSHSVDLSIYTNGL